LFTQRQCNLRLPCHKEFHDADVILIIAGGKNLRELVYCVANSLVRSDSVTLTEDWFGTQCLA